MLNIWRRWDADEHLCREKKAKDDIPQRGNNYTEYYFHSQKEHKDIILDQIKSITIYVKKSNVTSTPSE